MISPLPLNKVPWLSLALLLLAYATFSWFLYVSHVSWLAWAGVIMFTLAEALLLTTFSRGLRLVFRQWLTSDIGYFTLIIFGAFLVAIALVWIRIFSYIVVVVSSEVLARLELQQLGCNRWQSFIVLSLLSFVGLGIGLGASYLINH